MAAGGAVWFAGAWDCSMTPSASTWSSSACAAPIPGWSPREEHEAFGPVRTGELRRARTTMAAPRSRPRRTDRRGRYVDRRRSCAGVALGRCAGRRRAGGPGADRPCPDGRCPVGGCPRGRCPGLLEAWARRPPSLTCARCWRRPITITARLTVTVTITIPPLPGETTMHSGRLPSRSPPSLPHDVPGQEQLFEQRPARDFGFDE